LIRGPVAEISLSAIEQNLQTIKKIIRNRPIIAVVKADAYGHGAVEVSKRLLKKGISCLAVAYISEAAELRNAGISIPIIVLFDRGDTKAFFDFHVIPVLSDMDFAAALSKEARKRHASIEVHVKVDTGMGRAGFQGNHVIRDIMKISEMTGLEITGLLSHFSESDLSNKSYADQQLEKFNHIRRTLSEKLKGKIVSHMANSAAVVSYRKAHLDAVRPGIMLYGYNPIMQNTGERTENNPSLTFSPRKEGIECAGVSENITLVPAMTVKTRILSIRKVPSGTPISYGRTFITKRKSRIGVLSLGYADGYNRLFSNNAEVLIHGKRSHVAGRICMDLTMVDLTDIKEAEENDEVVILGRQGKESITADELAARLQTISYEILTTLGSRSRRTYVESC
jgi:alanine racemase